MKVAQSMSFDVDVLMALKARAEAEGKSLSRLANELLRAALRMGGSKPGNPLSERAQRVLEAITALTEAAGKVDPLDPRWLFREFRMDEICRKVGDFPSKVLPALRECERAGALKCAQVIPLGMDVECPKLEHWRLPSE